MPSWTLRSLLGLSFLTILIVLQQINFRPEHAHSQIWNSGSLRRDRIMASFPRVNKKINNVQEPKMLGLAHYSRASLLYLSLCQVRNRFRSQNTYFSSVYTLLMRASVPKPKNLPLPQCPLCYCWQPHRNLVTGKKMRVSLTFIPLWLYPSRMQSQL